MRLLTAIVATTFLSCFVDAQACQFPPEFAGVWKGNKFTDLTITGTQFGPLTFHGRVFNYECYLNEGSRYAIRSPEFDFGGLKFRYYICLNLTTSPNNNDVIYYYIGTENDPNYGNDPVISSAVSPNLTEICTKTTETPASEYNVLLKQGWENRLPVGSCPTHLQAKFMANFQNTTSQNENCTDFHVDGCNAEQRELTFNYTKCELGISSYKCVTSMQGDDNTTYTTLYTDSVQRQENPYVPYSCLEHMDVNGTLMITHYAGICGGVPSESMVLNETESCRVQPTSPSPPVTTTTAGSNESASSATAGNGGNGGQGGGGNGDVSDGGNAANGMHAVCFTFLAAMIIPMLALA